MRLLYSILAKYVELGPDGIFTLVGGGFSGLFSEHLPTTLSNISLLMKVIADPEENGDFRLAVSLADPSGALIASGTAIIPFTIQPNPDRREVSCLFQMQGLEIQRPGTHTFHISLLEGPELGTVAFTVKQTQEGQR